MKIVTAAVSALAVGLFQSFAKPYFDQAVPENWRTHWALNALFNGAFVLIAVLAVSHALKVIGMKKAVV